MLASRLSVQNPGGPDWLVTIEHAFNHEQSITFTVRVLKDDSNMVELEQRCIKLLIKRLQSMLSPLPIDQPHNQIEA